jgi:hypothetical protein
MAGSLGLGLGRSGCRGCCRWRIDRWGARCALLLRLRPVLPGILLSGSGTCLLRLSAAGAGYPPPASGYPAPAPGYPPPASGYPPPASDHAGQPGASAGDPVTYCTQLPVIQPANRNLSRK